MNSSVSSQVLLSIVVPVYNAQEYLSACLDSLLLQEFTNVEILVVNDGSTDSSGSIIERYTEIDQRIVLIERSHGDVSGARNVGLAAAQGKYVAFVDADDTVDQDMYCDMVGSAESTDADLVICGFNRITAKDTRQVRLPNQQTGLLSKLEIQQRIVQRLASNPLIRAPWNKLFRRTLIVDCGISFHDAIEYGEDFIFNIEYLSRSASVFYIDRCLYNYDSRVLGICSSRRGHLMDTGKMLMDRMMECGEIWGMQNSGFLLQAVGEFAFFARKQLRMNISARRPLSYLQHRDEVYSIVMDPNFRAVLTKYPFVSLYLFIIKNLTIKLLICASLLRWPELMLIKVRYHFLAKCIGSRIALYR